MNGLPPKIKNKTPTITCLFVDIGGVILCDGWDHHSRRKAAKQFRINRNEMELRHKLNFDTFEEGKLTLNEYLDRVIFCEKRSFTKTDFSSFMYAQSKPYPKMIQLIVDLKLKYGLKIGVVSNEARELNSFRINKFKLNQFVDFFISSCFVHLRKPDNDIYYLAMNVAQVQPKNILYIENTAMFVEVAEALGIQSICHTDFKSTQKKLSAFGLHSDEVHS